jgi:hypothetical protein
MSKRITTACCDSIAKLAELTGDTPSMAFHHYGRERGQHYQEPVLQAVGVARPLGGAGRKRDGAGRGMVY